ncbi:hypothetical protein DWB85_03175 [Seongchinamella sediminis]|uniref:Uncharacterized protein n=1 Tax=Seongchinamella sediminis TaxID=2283635 RepID=A0A3L7E0G5_9GAMM|nr:hypothetical protein [Seongchinamella sediminis]RLQ22996.1 hypothetical protein DWB85_03175 [Seongchinamella sediminis]
MIISLNISNAEHVQHLFRRYPRAVYGLALPYSKDCSYTGVLSQGEDLFISGHGSAVSIGHQEGEPRFTPAQMADWLEQWVLPCNYWGNIYIAAPGARADYLDSLLKVLGPAFAGRLRGQFDLAYSQLNPPEEDTWIRVA